MTSHIHVLLLHQLNRLFPNVVSSVVQSCAVSEPIVKPAVPDETILSLALLGQSMEVSEI